MNRQETREQICQMIDKCDTNVANIDATTMRLINTMHQLLYQYNIVPSIHEEIKLEDISTLIDGTKNNKYIQLFIKEYLTTFLV